MGNRKKPPADPYLIDRYQSGVRVWPLFGLSRLVKLEHRKRGGVLYCDNGLCASDTITFSKTNTQTALYMMYHSAAANAGVHGEPRHNVPNEASEADMQRYHDYGTEVVFAFTPKSGHTFSIESDMYRTFDAAHRYVRCQLPENVHVARWELKLDVSAYIRSGYSGFGEPPRCEFERDVATDGRRDSPRAGPRSPISGKKGPGLWSWHVEDVAGGTFRLVWELARGDEEPGSKMNLEKLATELSIDLRLAKDLHNFVMICHYYVAGYRSLNKIGPAMMGSKSVLNRSIEALEKAIGVELVRRTKGKGLIQITPAGEEVLDWWSKFYMRWTPVLPSP